MTAFYILWGMRGTRALTEGLVLLLLCAGIIHASPFQSAQRLTLGNMKQDGDLFFRIKISSIELSDDTSLEIFLDHEMDASDYGTTQSRFRLRPFETSTWERETGEIVWEKPGGGRQVAFSEKDAAPKNPPLLQMDGFPSLPPKFSRLNNALAGWNETGDAWVRSESWELIYKNGGLSAIRSPENKLLPVSANGGKIAEIRAGRRALASVEWSPNGNPAALRRGENRYVFVEDGRGRVARVIDVELGAAIIELSYNKDGLIEQVKRIGSENTAVSWRKNRGHGRGDSFYKKPFSVRQINDIKYDYSQNGTRVTMKMKPFGSDWRHL
jgi:hypothetical protein